MLNNLFKVCWKWKNADVISFFVTRKFQRKFSYFLKDMRNLNAIFRQDVTYDNVKSHKEAWVHPLFRRYIFGKTSSNCKVEVYDLWLYFVFKLLKYLVSSLIWFIDSHIIRWRKLRRIEGYVNWNGYGCILVENFEINYWF